MANQQTAILGQLLKALSKAGMVPAETDNGGQFYTSPKGERQDLGPKIGDLTPTWALHLRTLKADGKPLADPFFSVVDAEKRKAGGWAVVHRMTVRKLIGLAPHVDAILTACASVVKSS